MSCQLVSKVCFQLMLQRPLLRLLAVQVMGGPLRVTGGRKDEPLVAFSKVSHEAI
jgi:hypothetical protein